MYHWADYPIDWYIKSSIDRQIGYNVVAIVILVVILITLRRLVMCRRINQEAFKDKK